jgi:hypothetical protein
VTLQKTLTLAVLSLFAAVAVAQGKKGDGPPGPCKQIEQACKTAGFIKGDWKKGDGLWRDCVDPIMQGQSNVAGATKPLPSVDAKAIADCKAQHPKFGHGKVGSAQK